MTQLERSAQAIEYIESLGMTGEAQRVGNVVVVLIRDGDKCLGSLRVMPNLSTDNAWIRASVDRVKTGAVDTAMV